MELCRVTRLILQLYIKLLPNYWEILRFIFGRELDLFVLIMYKYINYNKWVSYIRFLYQKLALKVNFGC